MPGNSGNGIPGFPVASLLTAQLIYKDFDPTDLSHCDASLLVCLGDKSANDVSGH